MKQFKTHKWFLGVILALLIYIFWRNFRCDDGNLFPCIDDSLLSQLGDIGAVLTALALWYVRGEIGEQIEREKKGRGVDGLSKFLTTIERIDSQYRIPVTQDFLPEEARAIVKGKPLKINDEEKREAFSHLLGNNDQKDGDDFTLDKNKVLRLRSAIGDVLNRLNWIGMIEEEYGGIDIMKRDMIDFLSPKLEAPTAETCQKIRDEYREEEYERYFEKKKTNNADADKEIDLYVMKRTKFFNIREAVREASGRDRYPGITAFIKRHIKDINEEWRETIRNGMKNHPQQQGEKSANTPT